MKSFKTFLVCLLVMLAAYGCAVFITQRPDVTAWTEDGRFMFLLFGGTFAAGGAVLMNA
jgi:hypothetical protein